MSQGDGPIENYLDDLLGRLSGRPSEVRRALREAEDHLYSDADARVAAGEDRHAAELETVARFGNAAAVAESFNLTHRTATLREVIEQLIALAGLGLVAIGISGLVEIAMTAIWGKVWVFADPPGTHYQAASCRYWESLHPHAVGCAQVYVAEAMSDGLLYRFVAGTVGLVVLAVLVVMGRRSGRRIRGVLATPVTVVLGGVASSAAAAVFLAVGADRLTTGSGHGAGQWLSAVVVSVPIAAAFGWAALRRIRRVGLPVW